MVSLRRVREDGKRESAGSHSQWGDRVGAASVRLAAMDSIQFRHDRYDFTGRFCARLACPACIVKINVTFCLTTGRPKCVIRFIERPEHTDWSNRPIVHRAGGMLLQSKKEFVICADLQPSDVFFYYTTT